MNGTKAIINSFVDAVYAKDIEQAISYLSSDIVIHHTTRLPYAGEYRGHKGFRTLLGKMNEFWEHIDAPKEKPIIIVQGSIGIVAGELNGRARATGQTLSIPVLERHRVEGGKILELWPFYVDTHVSAAP